MVKTKNEIKTICDNCVHKGVCSLREKMTEYTKQIAVIEKPSNAEIVFTCNNFLRG